MSHEVLKSLRKPSAAVRQEAAVWIARIHSPDRAQSIDAGLRRWLAESQEHRQAFELANELWDTAKALPDGALPRMMRWDYLSNAAPRPRPEKMRPDVFGFGLKQAAALSVLAAVVGTAFYLYTALNPTLTTAVGEQRTLTLNDGSRVVLNTDTRLVVRYEEHQRGISLDSGEALFEVVKDPERPFVVHAGDHNITALGTSFVVRRDDERTAVTLVEGKVVVSSDPTTGQGVSSASTTLVPGQRLTFEHKKVKSPTLDRPEIEKVTAWQRGLVSLDRTRLSDAAAEMNRYSTVKLIIEDPHSAEARISGVFRAGDTLYFAQAIAQTYNLRVTEERGRIVITGASDTAETLDPGAEPRLRFLGACKTT